MFETQDVLRAAPIVISFIHVYFFGTFLFSTKSQQISVGTAIWSIYKGSTMIGQFLPNLRISIHFI